MCGGNGVARPLVCSVPCGGAVALAVTAATLFACGAAATASAGLGGLLAPVLAAVRGRGAVTAIPALVGLGELQPGRKRRLRERRSGLDTRRRRRRSRRQRELRRTSATDGRSLTLPAGSSATSPATCVGTLSPTLRFFARNTGAAGSALRVDVLYTDALGLRWAVPIATLSGSTDWAPSPATLILANVTALPLLSGGAAQVSFRFVPLGAAGAWQIDDVYVDPYKGS